MNAQPTEKTVGSNLTTIPEYTDTAAALAELRKRHEGVVYDVRDPKQLKKAKEARAEVKGYRVALEHKRKEIKEPAWERCKQIDSEAKRITGELLALEEPIDVQIKAEEARAEAEKLAKLEAERLRVEAIQQKIQSIRDVPASLTGKPSVIIAGQLAKLEAEQLDEDEFGEYFVTARDALDAAIGRVTQLLQVQREHEAEQRRVQEERAELERMREENERLQREAEERRRADEEKAAAERAEADRKAQEERDRLAAEQRAKEDAERAERAEAERLAREHGEAIDAQIAAIRNVPDNRYTMTVEELQEELDAHEILNPSKSAFDFGEHLELAIECWESTRGHLGHLIHERQKKDRMEAELRAERERQDAERRRLDEEAQRLQREREEAAAKAEAERVAKMSMVEVATDAHVLLCTLAPTNAVTVRLGKVLKREATGQAPARGKKAANA